MKSTLEQLQNLSKTIKSFNDNLDGFKKATAENITKTAIFTAKAVAKGASKVNKADEALLNKTTRMMKSSFGSGRSMVSSSRSTIDRAQSGVNFMAGLGTGPGQMIFAYKIMRSLTSTLINKLKPKETNKEDLRDQERAENERSEKATEDLNKGIHDSLKDTTEEQTKRLEKKLDKLGDKISDTNGGLVDSVLGGSGSGLLGGGLFGDRGKAGKLGKVGKLGRLGGLGGGLKSVGRIGGKLALPLTLGLGVFDAVEGYASAGETFGETDPQLSKKVSSSIGSVISGLTLGVLDKDTIARAAQTVSPIKLYESIFGKKAATAVTPKGEEKAATAVTPKGEEKADEGVVKAIEESAGKVGDILSADLGDIFQKYAGLPTKLTKFFIKQTEMKMTNYADSLVKVLDFMDSGGFDYNPNNYDRTDPNAPKPTTTTTSKPVQPKTQSSTTKPVDKSESGEVFQGTMSASEDQFKAWEEKNRLRAIVPMNPGETEGEYESRIDKMADENLGYIPKSTKSTTQTSSVTPTTPAATKSSSKPASKKTQSESVKTEVKPSESLTPSTEGDQSPLSLLLSKTEGGYDSVNLGATKGYKAGKRDLENMTIDEVLAAQSERDFNAAGRYQIINKTLLEAKEKMKLKGGEKFDKDMQDRIFHEYLAGSKRPQLDAYLHGRSDDIDAAILAGSKEWASLPYDESGKSYYAKDGVNKAHVSYEKYKEILIAQREYNLAKQATQIAQVESSNTGFKNSLSPQTNKELTASSIEAQRNINQGTDPPKTNVNVAPPHVVVNQPGKVASKKTAVDDNGLFYFPIV